MKISVAGSTIYPIIYLFFFRADISIFLKTCLGWLNLLLWKSHAFHLALQKFEVHRHLQAVDRGPLPLNHNPNFSWNPHRINDIPEPMELSNGRFRGTQKSSMNFGSMAIFSHWWPLWILENLETWLGFPRFFPSLLQMGWFETGIFSRFLPKSHGKSHGKSHRFSTHGRQPRRRWRCISATPRPALPKRCYGRRRRWKRRDWS